MDIVEISLISATIVFISLGQIFQKLASRNINCVKGIFIKIFSTPYVLLAGISLALGMLSWLFVLRTVKLSIAYPMLSLSYVIITLVGKIGFKEKVPLHRWLGVSSICIGIFFLFQG